MLLEWFEADFNMQLGTGTLLEFLKVWLSEEQKKDIEQLLEGDSDYSISYQFDWAPSIIPLEQ